MEKSQKHSAFSCIFMQLQLLLTNFECSAPAWRMDFFGSHSGMDARTFRSAPNPTANPAERIAVGKEEQRHERALTLKKVGASDIELDPTWCRWWDSNPHTIAGNGF